MYLKIAGGVIISFILSILPIVFHAYVNMEDHPPVSETIAICTFTAAMFVFLSSLFVPSAKKAAAITALILCCILDLQRLLSVIGTPNADITIVYMIPVGALIGLLISFLTFQDKGWSSSANQ